MTYYTPQLMRRTMRSPVGGTSFAKPKAAAADYRNTPADFGGTLFDATALALHKKYPISILGMTVTQAQVGQPGYNFVAALRADSATRDIAQYSILNQQFTSAANSGGATYAPIYNGLDALTNGKDFWARDVNSGQKTKGPLATSFPTYEVNILDNIAADANGKRAYDHVAEGYHTMLFSALYAAGLNKFFNDNVYGNPGGTSNPAWNGVTETGSLPAGVMGDYDRNGTNDAFNHGWPLRNSGVNPAFRRGEAAYVTKMKALMPNIGGIANADYDFINDATYGNSCLMNPELSMKFDYAFIEAATSNVGNDGGCITAFRSNFSDFINRYYTAEDNVVLGCIVNSYLMTSNDGLLRSLQKARFCLGVTMLGNGWTCVSDRLTGSSTMRPWWFPELDQSIGSPIEARPTSAAAGFDGMWKRQYSNGLILVNPSQNKGRWMGNGPLTTLVRNANVVQLTMPTANVPAGINGRNIRIQDCTDSGFNGVFGPVSTSVSGSNTIISWSQTGSNTSTLTNASGGTLRGYWGFQSSVNLTALGLKRFQTTEVGDAANAYNGVVGTNTNAQTSQNNGTNVVTIDMWPNDAILLLKQ
jgi:hypothetical protein